MPALEQETRSSRSPAAGPDGIPAEARRRTGSPRQVLAACAIGALVLALLTSSDLPSWAERLGDGPLPLMIRETATAWNEHLAPLGLTLPHEALRRGVRWLIEQQWPQITAQADIRDFAHLTRKTGARKF